MRIAIPAVCVALAVAASTADAGARQAHSHPTPPSPAQAKPQTGQQPARATQKPHRPKPENQPGAVMDAAKLAASHADHHEMEVLDGGGVLPEGWRHRFDLPTMKLEHLRVIKEGPDLHVTSGPPGILYDPSVTATGEFSVHGTFTQLAKAEHREGYGPFVGGAELEGDDQRYVYFLIRQDGRFLVKERVGANTRGVVDWTLHKAIKPFGEDGRMTNDLSIVVGADSVRFLINGTEVARRPRHDLATDGIVGVRVNHQLDIRIEKLTVEPPATSRY